MTVFFCFGNKVEFIKQRGSFRPCPADADSDDCHFDVDLSGLGAGFVSGLGSICGLVCVFSL
jgi:hypothetical protein